MKNNPEEVCLNCEYSFQGYGESSMNYGLRCSMRDDVSIDKKDSCKAFEINNYYKVKQLEQELQKTREQLNKAEDILKMYASRNNWNSRKEAIMLCEYVGGETARQYFKDKQGE